MTPRSTTITSDPAAPAITTGTEMILYSLGRLSEYLELGNLLHYLNEIKGRSELVLQVEAAVSDVEAFETKQFENVYDFRLYRILQYVLVRELKPDVMLETGVLHGLTSHFLLHALSRNNHGRLVSIDFPSYFETGPANNDGFHATLPPGKEPGWIIPPQYRDRWELRLGPSLEQLPAVLEEHDQLDIFSHDSDHSYEVMWGELNLTWEKVRDGGIVLCDNIDSNTSFFDFCRKVDRAPIVFSAPDRDVDHRVRFGLIRK